MLMVAGHALYYSTEGRGAVGLMPGMIVCRFTYQLLQGYDFVHLNRQHGVRLQVPLLLPCCGADLASTHSCSCFQGVRSTPSF
jgi:hypothetical protein